MNLECMCKVHFDGHHSHPKNIIMHSSGSKVLFPWFFKMKYYFNDTGTLEPSELRQYLNGPPLEIEVHDRDRKPEGVKLKPTLFGDDLEDEKISNVGTVASRSLLHVLHFDIWKTEKYLPWSVFYFSLLSPSAILRLGKFHCLKLFLFKHNFGQSITRKWETVCKSSEDWRHKNNIGRKNNPV